MAMSNWCHLECGLLLWVNCMPLLTKDTTLDEVNINIRHTLYTMLGEVNLVSKFVKAQKEINDLPSSATRRRLFNLN